MPLSTETSSFTEAILLGKHRQAADLFHRVVSAGTDYVTAAQEIIQRALYEVGDRWRQNVVSVAQEHLATAISHGVLSAEIGRITPASPNGLSAVLSCAQGNQHWMGLHIVADAFALAGWEVSFLGADMPIPDLVDFVVLNRPHLVGFSLTLNAHASAVRNAIAQIKERVGANSPVFLIGGLAVAQSLITSADVGADLSANDALSAVTLASARVAAR